MDLVKARRKAKEKKDGEKRPEAEASAEAEAAPSAPDPSPETPPEAAAAPEPAAEAREDKAPPTAPKESEGKSPPKSSLPKAKKKTPPAKETAPEEEDADLEGDLDDDFLYAFPSEETYIQSYGRMVETEEMLKFISFKLSSEDYAVDMMRIQEIIRLRHITEAPRTPAYISGIISLRGVIVPVLDLRKRLGLDAVQPGRDSRILITKEENDLVAGLLVDRVMEVVKIREKDIEPPPVVVHGLEAEHLKGIGRADNRIYILLNLNSIVKLN